MKTKITALFLAAAAVLAFVPKQAHAGDKEIALIGGFIGGLVVGSALHDQGSAYVGYETTTVGYDRNPGYGYDRGDDRRYDRGYGRRHDRDYDRRPAGHWEVRSVRVWVPAHWETRYDYGRRVQFFVPGYYEVRRERVWVAHRGGYNRGYERNVGYGPRRW